jgi:hypothetical protein
MDFPRTSPFKADKKKPSGRQESVSMEVQGAGKELHTNQKKAAATAKVNRWGSSAKQQVPALPLKVQESSLLSIPALASEEKITKCDSKEEGIVSTGWQSGKAVTFSHTTCCNERQKYELVDGPKPPPLFHQRPKSERKAEAKAMAKSKKDKRVPYYEDDSDERQEIIIQYWADHVSPHNRCRSFHADKYILSSHIVPFDEEAPEEVAETVEGIPEVHVKMSQDEVRAPKDDGPLADDILSEKTVLKIAAERECIFRIEAAELKKKIDEASIAIYGDAVSSWPALSSQDAKDVPRLYRKWMNSDDSIYGRFTLTTFEPRVVQRTVESTNIPLTPARGKVLGWWKITAPTSQEKWMEQKKEAREINPTGEKNGRSPRKHKA